MKARQERWGGATGHERKDEGMTRRAEVEAIVEDDLATAEARVIEWAINRIEAEAVSWNTVDRCTRQLDVVTRALIRLRAARTDGTGR